MPYLAAIGVLWLVAAMPQPELRPVEEGFEDVSPLASPSRIEPKDFRKPTGFEKVYKITTPSGKTAFVRIDNGLVAIFNRSDYIAGTDIAHIPPNTRFLIGTQNLTLRQTTDTYTNTPAAGRVNARPSTRVSNRVPNARRETQQWSNQPPPDAAIESSAPETPDVTVTGPSSITTNELYRRLRITQLLQSAISKD